ncbi:long-chain acyl-CoA synthetase [Pseudohyphozyma bogoriensis]|nr:long-chain acyl-CoA synthetase [Pseudohyphozyma bogoriensis]
MSVVQEPKHKRPNGNPFPIPLAPGFSRDKQSFTKPNPNSGESDIYIHAGFPHLPNPNTADKFPKTAYGCFNLGLATVPQGKCFGRRPWDDEQVRADGGKGDWAKRFEWETYEEIDARRTRVGSGLVRLKEEGVVGSVERQWKVGVWSVNRPEWQIASQACSAYSLVLVSLYDTLGPNVVRFCINHADISLVFAAVDHIPALLKLADECKGLKVIVSMDAFVGRFEKSGKVLREWGEKVGIKVMGIDELEALGAAHLAPHIPPKGEDVASICYTSGTTGDPKGAVLSHHNLASAAIASLHGNDSMEDNAVVISYLPLSHIYQRFAEDVALSTGAAIGYSCGDNLRLLEDIQLLQPTYFISVPRVLNRVYQALKAQTVDAPGVKGALLRKVFAAKMANLKSGGGVKHPVYDVLLRKVRAALGGNVVLIGSGSAPIAPEVLDFLKVAFSCEVTEGYGQTENCGIALRCVEGDIDAGTCGPPQPGSMVKLVDVPDMGYFSTDKPYPRGEICTKAGNVITEYYKDPKKSAETVDQDGWLHSGDIGLVDEKGRFKIIDRIKNLVKLSQGEYVALEKVENIYGLCPLIAQIYVHGDGLKDHVVAVLVPDPEKFAPLAAKVLGKSIATTDIAALEAAAKDPKVVAAVGKELTPYAEKAKLNGFERINNDIFITMDPFTMENDLLTPTLKTKRNVAAKKFKVELDKLYDAKPKKVAKL